MTLCTVSYSKYPFTLLLKMKACSMSLLNNTRFIQSELTTAVPILHTLTDILTTSVYYKDRHLLNGDINIANFYTKLTILKIIHHGKRRKCI